MPVTTDQAGRSVTISQFPSRIISVVPSQTELLASLELNKEVIGITKFCIHPEAWFRQKQRVGGTKQLKIDLIRSLQPDLIIANKEENVKEQVEMLAKDFPVWVSDVNHLEDALDMIRALGKITGREETATHLSQKIKTGFDRLNPVQNPVATAYLIWKDPYMTAGGDTFINDMLKRAGLKNIFENETRYPVVSPDELKKRNCELLLLSSEPYPFGQEHIDEWQQRLPGVRVLPANGEMFSWYGSRLQYAPAYFASLREQVFP